VVKLSKALSVLGVAALLSASMAANAGVVINEGFNGAGLPTGWATATGAGAAIPSIWSKPVNVAGTFPAQAGAPDSYFADSNPFFAVTATIADYLITPTITINNGTIISFFVRGDPVAEALFPDDLRVLFSVGTGASPATFTRVLADLNPGFSPTGIPTDWTQINLVVNGLAGATTGRLAFEYFVNNTSINGDLLGIDSVLVTVPEPDSLALAAVGLVALGLSLRKSRKQKVLA
jgi:hypothetical protein